MTARVVAALLLWSSIADAQTCRRARGVRLGEITPCAGVLLPVSAAKRCARVALDVRRCRDDLHEWKRRALVPLPRECTPVVIEKIKHIQAPRATWVHAISVTIGAIAGALIAWRVIK